MALETLLLLGSIYSMFLLHTKYIYSLPMSGKSGANNL